MTQEFRQIDFLKTRYNPALKELQSKLPDIHGVGKDTIQKQIF